MTLDCTSLGTIKPLAASLCREISKIFSFPPERFDTGIASIDYRNVGVEPKHEAPDKKIDPVEVYQAYLDLVPPDSATCPACLGFFKKQFGTIPPWVPIQAATKDRIDQLAVIIQAKVAEQKKTMPDADADMLIAAAIIEQMRTPKVKGGLGLKYKDHTGPEGTIDTLTQGSSVRCSEFQTVFYAIGKKIGLKMYSLEIPQDDEDGNLRPHAAVLVVSRVTGQRFFVDYQLKHVTSTPPYKTYHLGTAADLFGTYLFNASMVSVDGGMEISSAGNIPLLRAPLVAPGNDLVLFGLGMYYRARNQAGKAASLFRKTIEANPKHLQALRSLCLMTFDPTICQQLQRLTETSADN